MQKQIINTLRPNATAQDAIRAFRGSGVLQWYQRIRRGSLHRIADVYVPFWIYRVSYAMNGAHVSRWLAMDAVNGSLDLFEFAKLPGGDELCEVQTRNVLESRLSLERAGELLREKALRVVFEQGFFKWRNAELRIEQESITVHMPYWLGFHASGARANCRVMDAVRRRVEGAKAAAFFEQWLAA